ncbi:ABC transporter ATP-binding protein [Microtetraspora sp. NBRC 13810]|uniref:dipeptide ABC transporter ATP-binding protein n=1 Tax=Microtetraspora sp. NBRC 13810 TaxID=3030990 RepID=UPI0024A1D2AD|nr:ABC transporter ATP-binding protein [Microtetraspora sp. NBRC 13810]GLW08676.1 ABC transporter ATP-binding protein [Microtetraspora sp. NBRC 13810]
MSLVTVEDLRVGFPRAGVRAVRGIGLTVGAGECVAIVGESGSGKSVTARSLVGLPGPGAEVTAARFEIGGRDALRFGERDWRRVRGGFAGLVLQDALVSLDPLRRVGDEIAEVLATHDVVPRAGRARRAAELLASVGVPEPETRARQYPHQLSGGLRQRALIASALAADPPLIIADEPTTALDVTVQAQVLALLAARKAEGTALLMISHDLAVVASIADRVLVMKDGVVVEEGPTGRVLAAPGHDYTRTLLAAVPSAASRGTRLSAIAAGGVALRTPLPPREARGTEPILSADRLTASYGSRRLVDEVSLEVRQGETVGIVGESGSGKTTVARLLLGLLEPASGEVRLRGERWSGVPERRRRRSRTAIQLISQNPLDSFDPRYTVGRLVAEPLTALPRHRRRDRVSELLDRVGLDGDVAARHPRALSGGQRQRVAIARALAPRPDILVCDEPVSALDVSIQAQVLDLLAEIQAADGTSLVFISHDLGVVHHVSDRVVVMRGGRVVEEGHVDEVFFMPREDYTRDLLAAVPTLGRTPGRTPG